MSLKVIDTKTLTRLAARATGNKEFDPNVLDRDGYHVITTVVFNGERNVRVLVVVKLKDDGFPHTLYVNLKHDDYNEIPDYEMPSDTGIGAFTAGLTDEKEVRSGEEEKHA